MKPTDSIEQALEQAETMFARYPNLDLEQVQRLLEDVQTSIRSDSPHRLLFKQLQAQYQAVRQLGKLDTLLNQPFQNWLDPDATTRMRLEVNAMTDELRKVFDEDSPIVQNVEKRVKHLNQERVEMYGLFLRLPKLEGKVLVDAVQMLETRLHTDYPLPRPLQDAQVRCKQWLEEQERMRSEEAERRNREALQQQYRALKRKLDNELNAPFPDRNELDELLKQAEDAARTLPGVLPPEDNPFDRESMDYYTLLENDLRYRMLPTNVEEQAATMHSIGNIIGALKLLSENLETLRSGDDVVAYERAKRTYQARYAELQQSMQKDVQTAVRDARELLARYDYAAVVENLTATQQHIQTAEVQLDNALMSELNRLFAEAQALAQREEQVRTQQKQATELMEQPEPDYRRAHGLLEEAREIAPWLVPQVEEQMRRLEDHQQLFVVECIQRADIFLHTNNFAEARTMLVQAERNRPTDEQRKVIHSLRLEMTGREQKNQQVLALATEMKRLIEQAKQGNDMALIQGRVAGLRQHIGSREQPLYGEGSWEEFDSYLTYVGKVIKVWEDYRNLLTDLQHVTAVGEEQKRLEIEANLQRMRIHDYLPVSEDLLLLKIEKLKNTRVDNNIDDHIDQIDHMITLAASFRDDRVQQEHDHLQNLRLVYIAEQELARLLKKQAFTEFCDYYEKIAPAIKANNRIVAYKRAADQEGEKQKQKQDVDRVLDTCRDQLSNGWEKPADFMYAVAELERFAKQPENQSNTDARIQPTTILSLSHLATNLNQVRSSYHQFNLLSSSERNASRYRGLQDGLDRLIKLLNQQSLLDGFTALQLLQSTLENVKNELGKQVEDLEGFEGVFAAAVMSFQHSFEVARCFQEQHWREPLKQFDTCKTRYRSSGAEEKVAPYLDIITRIIGLLGMVDEAFATLIAYRRMVIDEGKKEGWLHILEDPREKKILWFANGRGPVVRKTLEEIGNESRQIAAHDLARNWPGIEKFPRYQALKDCYDKLGPSFDRVDWWLDEVKQLDLKHETLQKLESVERRGLQFQKELTTSYEAIKDMLHDIGDELHKHVQRRGEELKNWLEKHLSPEIGERKGQVYQQKRKQQMAGWITVGVVLAMLLIIIYLFSSTILGMLGDLTGIRSVPHQVFGAPLSGIGSLWLLV